MLHLQQIQRAVPLVLQVYEYLKEAILSGKFEPNERIVETKLAADLKVSRSPVREAIRLLIGNQLLFEDDTCIRVFQPTVQDFFDIYDLRLAIEPIAAKSASKKIDTNSLKCLSDNLEETKKARDAGNMDALVTLNDQFHRLIWQVAGNRRFVRTLEEVSELVQYYWHLVLDASGQRTDIVADHTEIFEALQRGNEHEAYDAMHRHIMKDLAVISRQVEAGQRVLRA